MIKHKHKLNILFDMTILMVTLAFFVVGVAQVYTAFGGLSFGEITLTTSSQIQLLMASFWVIAFKAVEPGSALCNPL